MSKYLGMDATDKQPYYFVSYNSEDEERVSAYARKLQALGIPFWYDYGIKTGAEWEKEIADKIEYCESVIMFFTENILHKENSYVQTEYTIAKEHFHKDIYVLYLDEIDVKKIPNEYRGWFVKINRLQCIKAYEHPVETNIKVLVDHLGIELKEQTDGKDPRKMPQPEAGKDVAVDRSYKHIQKLDSMIRLPNKDFAFNCLSLLRDSNRIEDIEMLTNAMFCKNKFDMRYPILFRFDSNGVFDCPPPHRYYSDPIKFNGNEYFVCNDWHYDSEKHERDTRTPFAKWVLG